MNSLPKTAERRLNSVKIEYFVAIAKNFKDFVSYEEIAPLLLLETKSADLVYDLGIAVVERVNTGRDVEPLILQAVSKLQLFDFLVTYRRFSCCSSTYSAELFSYLLGLFELLLELKVGSCVVGFNSSTGEVFINDEYPTAMEAVILLGCKTGYTGFKFSPAKLATYLEMKYGDRLVDKLIKRSTKIKGLSAFSDTVRMELVKNLLKRIQGAGFVVSPTMLFSEKYTPLTYLDVMNWDREVASGNEANFCLLMLSCLGDLFERYNVFRERKKLLSEEGVILELSKPFEGMTAVKLSEIHNEDYNEHYIVVTFWNNGAARTIPISLTNPGAISCLALYEIDLTMILLVMEWFEIRESLVQFVRDMGFDDLKRIYGLSLQSEEDYRILKDATIQALEIPVKEALEGVRYCRPQHWNYEGTTKFNYKKKVKDGSGDYLYELRKIGAHVRKLQKGQHASVEKQSIAKRYCLELKPGYTLVEGYVRQQRVKAPSAPTATKSINCFK